VFGKIEFGCLNLALISSFVFILIKKLKQSKANYREIKDYHRATASLKKLGPE
jgi:hypothetical protein